VEIKNNRRIEASGLRRTARTGGADTSSFAAQDAGDAKPAGGLTGTGPLAAVDTILALQGLADSPGERRSGVQHGEGLLALLDEVRDGLLAGGIPRPTLNRLALAISKRRESFADPALQSVLDEIDLRARVELAKLEQSSQPTI
jgi:hypothetical protein